MKIALAQINSHLGNLSYNSDKIIQEIQKAKKLDADLIVFPEMSLLGYPPYDLLERKELPSLHDKFLKKIIKNTPDNLACLVGGLYKEEGYLYNAAYFILNGKIKKVFKKTLLPSYTVFYDARHFQKGDLKNNFITYKGKKLFITICEDIWGEYNNEAYTEDPLKKITKKVDHFINLSASPYTKNKSKIRKQIGIKLSKKHNASFSYVNQVGGQDEIVFDGQSFHIDENGKTHSFDAFKEQTDLANSKSLNTFKKTDVYSEIFQTLALGIKDYFRKSGFKKAHLGLSGGIDSALVYVLACEALGKDNVTAIAMPGPHSSKLSYDLASKLTKNHESEVLNFDINNCYDSFIEDFSKTFSKTKFGVMNENAQARLRGLSLMAFANQNNSLLLATSNKSELCIGYSTLYGDQCGALMPIGDLLKTEVFELCRWYNKNKKTTIPEKIITRAPSAELRPDQKDSDSLPPYKELDKAIENVITKRKKAKTELEKWVLNKSFKSEFKRWQACPILRVSNHGFGQGRMMPLAHSHNLD